MTTRSNGRVDVIARQLAAGRLGVGAVLSFVLSAAAPLTVTAGVITTAYAVTGITALPVAFLAVGAVLALFSVGYVAMARQIAGAGAFYAYIAHGLGRPAGFAAAWVALATYNILQVALYGGVGAALGPLLEQWLGWQVPWWALALAGWALVGVLGLSRVDVNGRVLALLLTAEIVVIVVFSLAGLMHPTTGVAGPELAFSALSPASLAAPGLGAAISIAVLGFVGFEASVVYTEESRDPGRTVPTATYVSIAIIAGVYALAAWGMQVAVGPDRIVVVSQRAGAETLFVIAAAHLGPMAVDIGRVLFVTSVFAALLAVHNTTARYVFALGREGVLPRVFGRTLPRTGAPHAGSISQSVVGLVVITVYAASGFDPVVGLFYTGGTLGGLGVLILITFTAVAVVSYFARRPRQSGSPRPVWRPVLAASALTVLLMLAVGNAALLFGVPADDPLRLLPGVYAVFAVIGLVCAVVARARPPARYQRGGAGGAAELIPFQRSPRS